MSVLNGSHVLFLLKETYKVGILHSCPNPYGYSAVIIGHL